jgi:hypothetical protein
MTVVMRAVDTNVLVRSMTHLPMGTFDRDLGKLAGAQRW